MIRHIENLIILVCFAVSFLILPAGAAADDAVFDHVEHHYVDNAGVKIHYVTLGEGPPLVMIHGFPDFWYTWRNQMPSLSEQFQVIAIDQRGYNLSDQPEGVDQYKMDLLVSDVAAVIRDTGNKKAVICGHDWGGMVAWSFAMSEPEMTDRLIVLNLPHPRGLTRELAYNEQQQKNSAYARHFQSTDAHKQLTAEGLAGWVDDPDARKKYVEAFQRSSFEAMLNYYKANYPPPPYLESTGPLIKVQCPVLVIHGLKDQYLLSDGLNNTWDWIAADLTLVTLPNAAHFVQHDALDLVTRSMRMWLNR
jgi:pimeloyl-ACP methyl ester carboxylesterase